jgi:hypothetical protein
MSAKFGGEVRVSQLSHRQGAIQPVCTFRFQLFFSKFERSSAMYSVSNKLKALALASSVMALGAAQGAHADQKPSIYYDAAGNTANYWMVTFYDDTSASHTQWATQGLCFSPAVARGTGWEGRVVSLTFPNWSGVYYTDGGDVYELKMNYAPVGDKGFAGNDFISFSLHSDNSGAGERGWDEWRDGLPSSWNVWGNAEVTRAGRCTQFSGFTTLPQFEKQILSVQSQIKPRVTDSGVIANTPLTKGQADPREVLPTPPGVELDGRLN